MKISRFFPYLLIFCTISAAMEIELSLPSFPDIARAFAVSEELIEATISLNFLGFCLASLFYGPCADRFGRRPVLIGGTILFFIGSMGCALASSIHLLLFSRLIQGMGAAGSFVVTTIMLSDAYKGSESTHWIGRLNAILTAAMACAPILGGYLNAYFGWASCYTFVAFMTILQLGLVILYLPETGLGRPIALKEVLTSYKKLFLSPRFMQSAFCPNLLCAGYMAFVAVIPFLYRDELNMPLREFAWHQTAIITFFSVMSYYANRIANYFGEVKTALVGSAISSLATVVIWILSLLSPIPSVYWITPLMCLFAGSCALPFAILFAASLSVIPDSNGPASSLLMSMRTLVCAFCVQLAGYFYSGTLFSSAAIVAFAVFISFVLALLFYKGRSAALSEAPLESQPHLVI